MPLGDDYLLFHTYHSSRVTPGINIHGFYVHSWPFYLNTGGAVSQASAYRDIGFLRINSTTAGRLSSGSVDLTNFAGDAFGSVADVMIENGNNYGLVAPPKLHIIIGNHHASTNSFYVAVWTINITRNGLIPSYVYYHYTPQLGANPRVAPPRTTAALRAAPAYSGGMDVRRARATPPMQRPGRLLVPRLRIPADSAAAVRAQTHEAAQHGAPEPAPHLPASQCGAPQSVVFT